MEQTETAGILDLFCPKKSPPKAPALSTVHYIPKEQRNGLCSRAPELFVSAKGHLEIVWGVDEVVVMLSLNRLF